jgi:hypothetical protein
MLDQAAPTTCPHGLRPGTTVCLHCRADARAQARHRRVKLFTRVTLLAVAGAVVVSLVVGGIMAVAPTSQTIAADSTSTVTVAAGEPAAVPPAPQATSLQPMITEGRRDLVDSIYAVREGANVTVYFDTETLRTRFDWKFEGVVRATLPLIYGQDVRVALDSIPSGTFVRGGGLLTDLPERGIPVAVGDQRIRVWPITRQGRDGPIVVAYRASSS